MFLLNSKAYNLVIQNHFISLINQVIFFVIHNIFTKFNLKFNIQFHLIDYSIHLFYVIFYNYQLMNVLFKILLYWHMIILPLYLVTFNEFIKIKHVLVQLIYLNITLDYSYYFLIVSISF